MTENEAIKQLKIFPEWNSDDQWLSVEDMEELVDFCIKAFKEIQQYRAIGTVKECREAREMQRAKKYERGLDKEVRCPICGTCTTDIFEHRYCTYCGQRLV